VTTWQNLNGFSFLKRQYVSVLTVLIAFLKIYGLGSLLPRLLAFAFDSDTVEFIMKMAHCLVWHEE
jgi:hypothetical protein